ncbi:MAG: hypothetical protein QXD43_03045, partial [Candidatus Aenigmatarchaeota archaeon]
IERYKDYIEQNEQKTVYELRKMIDPENESIKKLIEANRLNEEKSKERILNLIEALLNSIKNVYLPISFWLTYEEILELKACEPLQKALLIASILSHLTQNYYIIKINEGIKIVFSLENDNYLIDVSNNKTALLNSNIDEILKNSEFYFNRNVYVENDTSELE